MARTSRWKCCAPAAGSRSPSCWRTEFRRSGSADSNAIALPGRGRLHMACRLISSRHYAALFIAALTGCALLAPLQAENASAAPKAAVFDVEKLARIDDYFNNEVATGKIPGAMVLIKQHGQQVYFKTFGVNDPDTGRPMTADTIFPLHSMTKTITSFVAMMLVDQGRMKVKDPVSKYIPSFAKM